MRYQKEFSVHSYEINQFGNASLSSIFNYLNEIAWEHAQKLDWGFDALKKNNYYWVLSRIYISIEIYPKWQEKITVETWPTGTEGIYAFREYAVKNEQNEVIIRASSAWLILDIDNKKIIRPDSLSNSFQEFAQHKICRYPDRIKASSAKENLSFSPVFFTDLDINQHFNSVKYVERALNYYGIGFLNENEVAEIEVNYLKEGMPGDEIAVIQNPLNDAEDMVLMVRKSDLADLCSMKILWKRKNNMALS